MAGLVLLCGAVEELCIRVLKLNFGPYNYPLGRTHFPDFVRFTERFQHFHSSAFFAPGTPEFLYPAPAAVVYELFYLLSPRDPLLGFLCAMAGVLALAAVLFARVLAGRGVRPVPAVAFSVVVVACSYPVWSVFKQGNIEIAIWALVSAGIAFYFADRGSLAASCFGVAASMKIYPLMFLGLLYARRQYREMLLGGCVLAGATLVSLWLVCPAIGLSWHQYREGLEHFREIYVLGRRPETGTDHSLFALLKLMLRPFPEPAQMGRILWVYLLFAATAGCGLFFGRVRHLPPVNQVLVLSIASILLPPVSYEYTLLHLLAPLGLMVLLAVDVSRARHAMPGLPAALFCMVLLLGCMPELIWHGQVFEGQVKAIVLLGLLGIALRYRFGGREAGPSPSASLRVRMTTRGDAVL